MDNFTKLKKRYFFVITVFSTKLNIYNEACFATLRSFIFLTTFPLCFTSTSLTQGKRNFIFTSAIRIRPLISLVPATLCLSKSTFGILCGFGLGLCLGTNLVLAIFFFHFLYYFFNEFLLYYCFYPIHYRVKYVFH